MTTVPLAAFVIVFRRHPAMFRTRRVRFYPSQATAEVVGPAEVLAEYPEALICYVRPTRAPGIPTAERRRVVSPLVCALAVAAPATSAAEPGGTTTTARWIGRKAEMPRAVAVALGLLVAGCGGVSPVAPSRVVAAAVDGGGSSALRIRALAEGNTCPSGAPTLESAPTRGNLVELHWTAEQASVVLTLTHDTKAPVTVTASTPWTEWRGPEGHYVAVAQGIACGGLGQASNRIEFTLGGDDNGPAPGPGGPLGPPAPPVDQRPPDADPAPDAPFGGVAACREAVVLTGRAAVTIALVFPPGPGRVLRVTTKDAAHRPDYQRGQVERAWVDVEAADGHVTRAGLTDDIPDADPSATTAFAVPGGGVRVTVTNAGTGSVHGVCVEAR